MAKTARKVSSVISRQAAEQGFTRLVIEADIAPPAPDAISFSEIDLNLTLAQGDVVIAMRLDMFMGQTTIADLRGQAGYISWGLVTDPGILDLQLHHRNVVMSKAHDYGAATSSGMVLPFSIDYMDFPGHGLPCVPAPLYFAVKSLSMTIGGNFNFRLYYYTIKVSPVEALDLLQAMLPQSV
jgi:hypothetical protein